MTATDVQSGLDVWKLERQLSRAVFAVGLVVCGFLALRSPNRNVPLLPLLGFLGAYAAVKVVILILSLRANLPLWRANVAEIGALGVLGYMLVVGLSGWTTVTLICLLGIVALLLLGGILRRKAAQSL